MFETLFIASSAALLLVLVFGYKKYSEWNNLIKNYKEKQKEGLLLDLELATSDQLMDELKKRPLTPFLLVRPFEQGVQIESHNIPPIPTAHILTAAAFVVQKDLASRGIDFDGPKFSHGDDNPFSND